MRSYGSYRFRADSFNIIELLHKYRLLLLLTGLLTAVASAALTYTITPLFRSSVVLYPTTNVMETQALFGVQGSATPLFGDETATEKVLQVLKSDMIKEFLVRKYDLFDHYGIGSESRYRYTMLDGKMKKYIAGRKTQFNSVEITVLDSDPVIAAGMANDIAGQIDTVFNYIVKDAGRKSWSALDNSYREQLSRVRWIEDSLNGSGIKIIPQFIAGMKAGSGKETWAASAGTISPGLLKLLNMYESENENLSSIGSKLAGARILGWQDMPYTHIINSAKISERKAFPRRSIIVLTVTASMLLLLIFFLGLKDSITQDGKDL